MWAGSRNWHTRAQIFDDNNDLRHCVSKVTTAKLRAKLTECMIYIFERLRNSCCLVNSDLYISRKQEDSRQMHGKGVLVRRLHFAPLVCKGECDEKNEVVRRVHVPCHISRPPPRCGQSCLKLCARVPCQKFFVLHLIALGVMGQRDARIGHPCYKLSPNQSRYASCH